MNQTEFARKIGISQTNLSWLEQDGHTVLERNLKQISSSFNVREEQLRTGAGDKYRQDSIEEFFKDPTPDDIDRKILKSYIEMNPNQRQYIKNWIMSIAETEKNR